MNKATTNNIVKQRDYWFDNAKAFLILSVFVGHICECLIKNVPFENGTPLWLNTLFKFIYVFHMPVFMIISGRFAKGRIDRNDWISAIDKLIIPYIVVQFFMIIFYAATGYSKVTITSFFSPGYGLWYILVLGIYQIITPQLLKIFRHRWMILPLSLILMLIHLYQVYPAPAPVARIINFFPFFIFGYLTSGMNLDLLKKYAFKVLSIFMFIGLFLIITQDNVIEVALLSGKRIFSQYNELLGINKIELLVITAIRYIAGFVSFFFIMGISPVKKTVFTKLGTDSTYIYILHLFIIVALMAYDKQYNILDFCSNELFVFALILLTVPVSYFLVSSVAKKCTSWLVTPDFNLRKIAKKIRK